jgi:acetyltransferase-like isoleucine patch superfamily enzyme/SAM-dependent methyltransferase
MLRSLISRTLRRHRVEGLWRQSAWIASGPGTYVDPGVIADQPERIHIGAHCIIRRGVVLRPDGGEIVIGNNCVISHYCVFHGEGGIYVGDGTLIAPQCGFYAANRSYLGLDIPMAQQPHTARGIYLMGDNWIGAQTVVCDDVTLGKGAILGAHATVTRSIPMAIVAVGSPARPVRNRNTGEWDTRKVERAVASGEMPHEVAAFVARRAQRVAGLLAADDRVLEVGCGEGTMAVAISAVTAHFEGCDYSEEALAIARRALPQRTFRYANATNLGGELASFTKVVMCEVAEHLMPPQFDRALAEVTRVLAPHGTLILTTPLTGAGRRSPTYAHVYEYDERELRQKLHSHFAQVELLDRELGLVRAASPLPVRAAKP